MDATPRPDPRARDAKCAGCGKVCVQNDRRLRPYVTIERYAKNGKPAGFRVMCVNCDRPTKFYANER